MPLPLQSTSIDDELAEELNWRLTRWSSLSTGESQLFLQVTA